MHEKGVWSLAVDESFRYLYSAGKDRKVFITDLSEGTCIYTCTCIHGDPCDHTTQVVRKGFYYSRRNILSCQ